MRTIQSALQDILRESSWLQFGLSNRLFNLSQLAKFLQSAVAARTKKDITQSALLMALSRLQRGLERPIRKLHAEEFYFDNIQVASNLCIYSYTLSAVRQQEVTRLIKDLHDRGRFASFTQGLRQLTLFFSAEDKALVRERMSGRPLSANDKLAVVGGIFKNSLSLTPGFFNAVFQQLFIHGINVVEVASTYTELLIYVEERDMRNTFDVLYARFVRKADR